MIVSGEQLERVYEALKQDKYQSGDKSITVFVSNSDADSVCAASQLQDLFGKEDLYYDLVPVASYEEIREHCGDTFSTAEELRTVVLLNCGATEDVRTLIGANKFVRTIIIDSHRPVWHGHNTQEDTPPVDENGVEQEVMLSLLILDDDDPVPRSKVPLAITPEEAEGVDAASDDADSSSDEDSDDGDADGRDEKGQENSSPGSSHREQGSGSKRQQHQRGGLRDNDQAGGGDGAGSRRKKRRRTTAGATAARLLEIETYYQDQCGYGKPSSLLLHGLIHRLALNENKHLWCAIVGLTDQYIHQRVDKVDYEKWRRELEGHVAALNDDGRADDAMLRKTGTLNDQMYERPHITPTEDLRFGLLRHWSLSQAMRYTPHVAARLQTWRDKGMDNVYDLLGFMCMPRKEADGLYKHMKMPFRSKLKTALPKHAANHLLSMDQLQLASFELHYKQMVDLSASDMVLAITALLLAPPRQQQGDLLRTSESFLKAIQALNFQKNYAVLKEGIEHAKSLAQACVHDGGLLLTRNKVLGKRKSKFYQLDLSSSDMQHRPQFTHPIALTQLCLFLRDAQAQRTKEPKPVVVAGPPNAQGNCFVLGVRGAHKSGCMQANPFSQPFLDAAHRLNLERAAANFDNCVLLIPKARVHAFLEELKSTLASYDKEAAR